MSMEGKNAVSMPMMPSEQHGRDALGVRGRADGGRGIGGVRGIGDGSITVEGVGSASQAKPVDSFFSQYVRQMTPSFNTLQERDGVDRGLFAARDHAVEARKDSKAADGLRDGRSERRNARDHAHRDEPATKPSPRKYERDEEKSPADSSRIVKEDRPSRGRASQDRALRDDDNAAYEEREEGTARSDDTARQEHAFHFATVTASPLNLADGRWQGARGNRQGDAIGTHDGLFITDGNDGLAEREARLLLSGESGNQLGQDMAGSTLGRTPDGSAPAMLQHDGQNVAETNPLAPSEPVAQGLAMQGNATPSISIDGVGLDTRDSQTHAGHQLQQETDVHGLSLTPGDAQALSHEAQGDDALRPVAIIRDGAVHDAYGASGVDSALSTQTGQQGTVLQASVAIRQQEQGLAQDQAQHRGGTQTQTLTPAPTAEEAKQESPLHLRSNGERMASLKNTDGGIENRLQAPLTRLQEQAESLARELRPQHTLKVDVGVGTHQAHHTSKPLAQLVQGSLPNGAGGVDGAKGEDIAPQILLQQQIQTQHASRQGTRTPSLFNRITATPAGGVVMGGVVQGNAQGNVQGVNQALATMQNAGLSNEKQSSGGQFSGGQSAGGNAQGDRTQAGGAQPSTNISGSGTAGGSDFRHMMAQDARASEPSKPSSHSGPSPQIRQIAVNITRAISAGTDRISVQLRPQHLGRIEIQLEVSKDGKSTALVKVERPETLELLRADAKNLEKALENAGLNSAGTDLEFSLKGEHDDSANRHARNGGSDSVAEDVPDEVPMQARNIITETHIDVQI